ncbi:MAG: type II secretion system protein [Planctomycetota bacterium]|jgi:prepilin-type N-terminal cleavage/methylation domain-containing protein
MNTKNKDGFTLVEILIVVVILGILATLVIPQFTGFSKEAELGTFVTDVRHFAAAAEYYRAKTGLYLEDSGSGSVPAGWETYIDTRKWTNVTPLGGVWDFELNSFGITSGFGVHFDGSGATRDDAYMQEVDAAFDDGDLTSGFFQKLAADRYYYVIAD